MTRDQDEIEAKAKATADLLVQAVFEPDMLGSAWEAYSRVRQELARRHLAPVADLPTTERINLLALEATAFAAFIIMEQELPRWLTRKNTKGGDEPDVEWIRYFNTQFLTHLADHLGSFESPVRVDRRVAGYLRAGSSKEAEQDFARLAAVAMDQEHSALLQPVALRLVASVVGVSRILLKGVFTRRLTAT